jgi:DNA primase
MSDVKKTGLSVVNLQRLFKLDAPRDAVFKLLNAPHHLGVVSYVSRLQETHRLDRAVEGVPQTALYQIHTSRTGSQDYLKSLKRETPEGGSTRDLEGLLA